MKFVFNRKGRKVNTQRAKEILDLQLTIYEFCPDDIFNSKIVNQKSEIVNQLALGIEVKIPTLRVCSAICSTDCHTPLAMTDCSEKPDPPAGG